MTFQLYDDVYLIEPKKFGNGWEKIPVNTVGRIVRLHSNNVYVKFNECRYELRINCKHLRKVTKLYKAVK